MLATGKRGELQRTVTEAMTAKSMGSGELLVLATPAIVAMMEECAYKSVADELEAGQGTVGTKLEIAHLAASPVGATIRCESELCEVDRRRLVFAVSAFDDKEKVAEGTHERFIIDNEKFMNKAAGKLG